MSFMEWMAIVTLAAGLCYWLLGNKETRLLLKHNKEELYREGFMLFYNLVRSFSTRSVGKKIDKPSLEISKFENRIFKMQLSVMVRRKLFKCVNLAHNFVKNHDNYSIFKKVEKRMKKFGKFVQKDEKNAAFNDVNQYEFDSFSLRAIYSLSNEPSSEYCVIVYANKNESSENLKTFLKLGLLKSKKTEKFEISMAYDAVPDLSKFGELCYYNSKYIIFRDKHGVEIKFNYQEPVFRKQDC